MTKPKAPRRTELLDMGSRALAEYAESERRRYHQKIRAELIERGAIVQDVESLLEEAAPRFRGKGWKVTETKEQG